MGKESRGKRERQNVPEKDMGKKRGKDFAPLTALANVEDAFLCLMFFSMGIIFSTNLQIHFTLPKLVVLRVGALVIFSFWFYRFTKRELIPVPKIIFLPAIALLAWWVFSTQTDGNGRRVRQV